MPSEAGMEKLHADLLVLLKEFHKLCVENDIKYSLHGGSLLGAIREKGFIPWDDDIDVTMTRENYEKFRHYMNTENTNMDIALDEVNEGCYVLYMKGISGKNIWIDILIYDYISENWLAQKIKFLMLVFFLGWLKTKNTMQVAKVGKFAGWKYYLIYMLYMLGKPVSRPKKNKIRDYVAANFLCGSQKLMVRSNDQYIALKLYISKEAIFQYQIVEFEDMKAMIHAGYDAILRSSYGEDYMKPIRIDESHKKAHNIKQEGISI